MDREEFERLAEPDKIVLLQRAQLIAIHSDKVASLHLVMDFYVEVTLDLKDNEITNIGSYHSHEVPSEYLDAIYFPDSFE